MMIKKHTGPLILGCGTRVGDMTFSLVCSFLHTTHRMIKVVGKAPPNSVLAVSSKNVIASTTLAAIDDD